jgi:hypothetical protein
MMQKKLNFQNDFDVASELNRGSHRGSDFDRDFQSDHRSDLSQSSYVFKDKNSKENRFKPNDTISEVYDPLEK